MVDERHLELLLSSLELYTPYARGAGSNSSMEEDLMAFWRAEVAVVAEGGDAESDAHARGGDVEGSAGCMDYLGLEVLRAALVNLKKSSSSVAATEVKPVLIEEVPAPGDMSSSILQLCSDELRRSLLTKLLCNRGKANRCLLEDVLRSYKLLFAEGSYDKFRSGGEGAALLFAQVVSLRLAVRCLLLCLCNIFPLGDGDSPPLSSMLLPSPNPDIDSSNSSSSSCSSNSQLVHTFLLGLSVVDSISDFAPKRALESSSHETLLTMRNNSSCGEAIELGSARQLQEALGLLAEGRVRAMDSGKYGLGYVIFGADDKTTGIATRSYPPLHLLSTATSHSTQKVATSLLHQLYTSSSTRHFTPVQLQETIAARLISVARLWHSLPNSPATDVYTVFCIRHILCDRAVVINSAALAAAVPPALRLAGRFSGIEKVLGSDTIRKIIDSSPSTLLQSSARWLLPQLCTAAVVAAGSDNRAALYADRALQVSIAGSLSGEPAMSQCHQLLLRLHATTPPHVHQCVPLVLSLRSFLVICPRPVLLLRVGDIVGLLLSFINKWHLPLLCYSLEILISLLLQPELQQALLLLRLQIVVEMVRVLLTYSRSLYSSPEVLPDLSGGVDAAEASLVCRAAVEVLRIMQGGAWAELDAQHMLLAALDDVLLCKDGSSLKALISRFGIKE